MSESLDDQGHDSSRAMAIHGIVREYRSRCSRGESISIESFIQAHPHLMPELAEAFRHLQLLESVRCQFERDEASGDQRTAESQLLPGGIDHGCLAPMTLGAFNEP